MKLDKRLSAIAKFVPEGSKLADIGSDHAYLPTFLLLNKKIQFAVAGDVAAEPCKVARTTLAMYGVSKLAEVRQGDGLSVLKPYECDCLVFAGMGGTTIMDILQAHPDVARSATTLIFQPMQNSDRLREYLCTHNFVLQAEDLVEDGKYLYEIMVATPQASKAFNKAEYIIGPLLLRNRHPLLTKQFVKQKAVYQRILDGMQKSSGMRTSEKFLEISKILQSLEELEHEYC